MKPVFCPFLPFLFTQVLKGKKKLWFVQRYISGSFLPTKVCFLDRDGNNECLNNSQSLVSVSAYPKCVISPSNTVL